jgi:hypothetical protein
MRSSMRSVWRRLAWLMPVLAGLPLAAAPAAAVPACGQPGDIVWKEQFGTGEEDVARGVTVDESGGIAVIGYTRGDLVGPNRGGRDGFIISLAPDGSPRWQQQFGRTDDDYAEAVVLNPAGDLVVFGDTVSSPGRFFDVLLRRYSADGSLSWKRQFGSPRAEYVRDGAVDAAGNLFVAGTAETDWDRDAVLFKLTPGGDVIWKRLIGTRDPYSTEFGMEVAIDSAGSAILAGGSTGALAGPNRGSWDPFVVKYADDGTRQWKRQFGSAEADSASGVAADADDAVIVVGEVDWPPRGYVVKFDRTGVRQWWLRLPRVSPYTVAVSPENEIYVAGEGADLGGGMWVGKVSAAGQLLWGRTYEGAHARAFGIAIEPGGTDRLVLVGETQYDFAGVNQGGFDAWVARICR